MYFFLLSSFSSSAVSAIQTSAHSLPDAPSQCYCSDKSKPDGTASIPIANCSSTGKEMDDNCTEMDINALVRNVWKPMIGGQILKGTTCGNANIQPFFKCKKRVCCPAVGDCRTLVWWEVQGIVGDRSRRNCTIGTSSPGMTVQGTCKALTWYKVAWHLETKEAKVYMNRVPIAWQCVPN